MRVRLSSLLLLLMTVVLVSLGVPLATSIASSEARTVHADRLADLALYASLVPQTAGGVDAQALGDDLRRYAGLYGVQVGVVDAAGQPLTPFVTGNELLADLREGTDGTRSAVRAALAGRPSEGPAAALAVGRRAGHGGAARGPGRRRRRSRGQRLPVARPRRDRVLNRWLLLAALELVALVGGALLAYRLAEWLLRPIARLDAAAHQIADGDLGARVPAGSGPPGAAPPRPVVQRHGRPRPGLGGGPARVRRRRQPPAPQPARGAARAAPGSRARAAGAARRRGGERRGRRPLPRRHPRPHARAGPRRARDGGGRPARRRRRRRRAARLLARRRGPALDHAPPRGRGAGTRLARPGRPVRRGGRRPRQRAQVLARADGGDRRRALPPPTSGTVSPSSSPTRGRGWRPTTCRASATGSGGPGRRRPSRAAGWGCRSRPRCSSATAAPCGSRPRPDGGLRVSLLVPATGLSAGGPSASCCGSTSPRRGAAAASRWRSPSAGRARSRRGRRRRSRRAAGTSCRARRSRRRGRRPGARSSRFGDARVATGAERP